MSCGTYLKAIARVSTNLVHDVYSNILLQKFYLISQWPTSFHLLVSIFSRFYDFIFSGEKLYLAQKHGIVCAAQTRPVIHDHNCASCHELLCKSIAINQSWYECLYRATICIVTAVLWLKFKLHCLRKAIILAENSRHWAQIRYPSQGNGFKWLLLSKSIKSHSIEFSVSERIIAFVITMEFWIFEGLSYHYQCHIKLTSYVSGNPAKSWQPVCKDVGLPIKNYIKS